MLTHTRKVLKGYELRERIGAGGFGEVFRAYQPSVQREVAIKVILPQHANEPEFIRRFEVEAQLIARLEHPHIVPLYDYWRDPDGAYLVMRWLPTSLHKTIVEKTTWMLPDTARLLDQLCMALATAHRDNIVHRDIKPENILLDEDDNAYLADFGIAKDLSIDDHAANLDEIAGSPAYLSPEQIKGEKVSPRTDIYSLGYVIYELLTGKSVLPTTSTMMEYINHHLKDPLPLLRPQDTQIPAAIDEVLQTATAKHPDQRYASAERFAAAFRAALPSKTPRMTGQPLPDALTERELEVLRLLMEGLDNSQIADRLYVSPATVRWYLRQIYSKLDVHSRHQAIERAKILNLLNPTNATGIYVAPPVQRVTLEAINPYKGLRAFQEADTHDFFGRAALVEQLLNRLAEKRESARILVIVGPSGSGKSSVVKAGLLPALRSGALAGSPHPFIAEMFPGTHPFEELETALLRVAINPMPGLLEQLQEDRRGLVRAVKRILPGDTETELLLVIDQFEEVFTLVTDEAMRVHFIDNLLAAATDPRSRIRVIVTLRADFYDRPLLYPRLAELVRSHTELVLPLNARELEQAMLGPAERVGGHFEAGLVATIINEIGEQPGTLPLLQYALTELFERREGVTLTLEAYKTIGGVTGALARRADDLYLSLTAQEQAAVRQMFLRLVTLGEGTEDTRRRTLQSELLAIANDAGMIEDLILSFGQYRLLTLDSDPITRGPTVEVAHEALIRQWERLHSWLNESRDEIKLQRQLAYLASEWREGKHEASFLLRGARLETFEAWVRTTPLALTAPEHKFVEVSLRQRDQEQAAETERATREAQLETRSRSFLQWLVVVLVLAVFGAFVLTVFALNERQQAQAERDAAQELALVNGAQAAFASNDLDTARALSMAASTTDNPSALSQISLAQAAYAPGTVRVFTDEEYHRQWRSIALSPDEGFILTSSFVDNFPVVWDRVTGDVVRVFPPVHKDIIEDIHFRPLPTAENPEILTASRDGTLILWDFEQAVPIRTFTGHQDAVSTGKFNADGRQMVSASSDRTLILWDVDSGDILQTFTGHDDEVLSGEFSPDGRTILSASTDGSVIQWDIDSGEVLSRFEIAIVPSGGAVFSPDGRMFLAASLQDFTMSLWDIAAHREMRRFSYTNGPFGNPAFGNDGQTVFATEGNFINFWNIQTGAVITSLQSPGQLNLVTTPDQDTLIGVSQDRTMRLWDLRDGAELVRAAVPYLGSDGDISPDEQTFVTASGGDTLRFDVPGFVVLYNAATGEELRRFGVDGAAHTAHASSVRFSPDGQTILSADWSGEIKLWDAATGALVRQYSGVTSAINSIDFNPDGTAFITATDESGVLLWDTAAGNINQTFEFEAPVLKAIFSRDARQFLACLVDETFTIVLVDVASGQIMLRLVGQTNPCRALAFSPQGETVVSGHFDGSILLWDLAQGQLIRPFINNPGIINELVFSPDGQTVFSGSFGRAITLTMWDVATGEPYRRFAGQLRPVGGLDITADGKTLLSVAYDSTARLWRVDSPSELIAWTQANRYIRDLTCTERELYRIKPLCSDTEK
jgi:WD40 repeat protein/serine/threonine protein kinase